MNVSGQLQSLAAFSFGRELWCSLRMGFGGPQSSSGRVWSKEHLLLLPEVNRQIVFFNHRIVIECTYRSFATRVLKLKIWRFWIIGIARNVWRCTFNRYSVITQFAKFLESSCVVVALLENYSTSKPLKVSPENSQILSCWHSCRK